MTLCFFFNDTATTEIYTLSLHDALPISAICRTPSSRTTRAGRAPACARPYPSSEEHTSALQAPDQLVCRLLLEKKNRTTRVISTKQIGILGASGYSGGDDVRLLTAHPQT